MLEATPEGEPIACPSCRVVMLPVREAALPTIVCPQCGVWMVKVF